MHLISMGNDQYFVIKADFTFFGAFYFSNLDLIKIRVEVSNPPSVCFTAIYAGFEIILASLVLEI